MLTAQTRKTLEKQGYQPLFLVIRRFSISRGSQSSDSHRGRQLPLQIVLGQLRPAAEALAFGDGFGVASYNC
jgi:hypothetical protein